jgi:NO-binding membrane sensor protein with MHYT domain
MYRVLACLAGEHDYRLVFVAALICVSAAYTSFHIYRRVTNGPNIQHGRYRQLTWVGLTGLSTGAGIWSTHFVAMLAYDSGLPTAYDPALTLLSMLVAIVVTTMGYAIAGMGAQGSSVACDLKPFGFAIVVTRGQVKAALGGAVVGSGIGIMHYTGMLALRVPG